MFTRILLALVIVILCLTVAAAVYFRLVSMPAEAWHVDPATAEPPSTPNFELRQGADAPVVSSDPAAVAAALSAIAEQEGARAIAGSPEDGFVTYIVRSRLMGYPDAISIRLTPVEAGTRIEIFSRSRFGQSDMGVNTARVARWIDAATP